MDRLRSITSDQVPSLSLEGTVFVTTGEFQRNRESLEAFIQARGGILKGHCSRYTDFVIVGERGPSLAWKYFQYGTKLERAVKLRTQGFGVRIILENDFLRAVAAHPGVKRCAPVDPFSRHAEYLSCRHGALLGV